MDRRRAFLAALSGASLGVLAAAELRAQETNTVGPAVLRDYSLPGQRTTLPPPRPAPAPTATPSPAPAPRATRAPPPPPPARTAARPGAAAPAEPPPRAVEAPAGREVPLQPQPEVPFTEPAAPAPQAQPSAPAPQPTAAAGEPASGFPWPYLAGAALLALLGAAAFRSRRRSGEAAPEPLPAAPAPKPAAPQAVAPPPRPAGRAWLELEFKPGKAAATEAQASVEFELKIKNVGATAAENVLIEARMFNAGAQLDREIKAFFSAPDEANAVRSPRGIPPGGTATFRSVVAIPKENVREVVVQGRRLFIPMVAFNVLYRWGAGEKGQNSMSYLVGRETQPPAEKMAAFRLDLGPRIYRSVGFRPNKLAMNV